MNLVADVHLLCEQRARSSNGRQSHRDVYGARRREGLALDGQLGRGGSCSHAHFPGGSDHRDLGVIGKVMSRGVLLPLTENEVPEHTAVFQPLCSYPVLRLGCIAIIVEIQKLQIVVLAIHANQGQRSFSLSGSAGVGRSPQGHVCVKLIEVPKDCKIGGVPVHFVARVAGISFDKAQPALSIIAFDP